MADSLSLFNTTFIIGIIYLFFFFVLLGSIMIFGKQKEKKKKRVKLFARPFKS